MELAISTPISGCSNCFDNTEIDITPSNPQKSTFSEVPFKKVTKNKMALKVRSSIESKDSEYHICMFV